MRVVTRSHYSRTGYGFTVIDVYSGDQLLGGVGLPKHLSWERNAAHIRNSGNLSPAVKRLLLEEWEQRRTGKKPPGA